MSIIQEVEMPRKTMIPIVRSKDKECTILYKHPVKDWGKVVSWELYVGTIQMCVRCDNKCPIAHNCKLINMVGVNDLPKLFKEN